MTSVEELRDFIAGVKQDRDEHGIRTVTIDVDKAIEMASFALAELATIDRVLNMPTLGAKSAEHSPQGAPSLLCDGCGCDKERCDALEPPTIGETWPALWRPEFNTEGRPDPARNEASGETSKDPEIDP